MERFGSGIIDMDFISTLECTPMMALLCNEHYRPLRSEKVVANITKCEVIDEGYERQSVGPVHKRDGIEEFCNSCGEVYDKCKTITITADKEALKWRKIHARIGAVVLYLQKGDDVTSPLRWYQEAPRGSYWDMDGGDFNLCLPRPLVKFILPREPYDWELDKSKLPDAAERFANTIGVVSDEVKGVMKKLGML